MRFVRCSFHVFNLPVKKVRVCGELTRDSQAAELWARGSEKNRNLRTWEKILIRGRERGEMVRKRGARNRSILPRDQEKERPALPLPPFLFFFSSCSPRLPLKRFLFALVKYGSVGSPVPFLPFHANSISAFCAWKSRRYRNVRDKPRFLSLLTISFVPTCLPSFTR